MATTPVAFGSVCPCGCGGSEVRTNCVTLSRPASPLCGPHPPTPRPACAPEVRPRPFAQSPVFPPSHFADLLLRRFYFSLGTFCLDVAAASQVEQQRSVSFLLLAVSLTSTVLLYLPLPSPSYQQSFLLIVFWRERIGNSEAALGSFKVKMG